MESLEEYEKKNEEKAYLIVSQLEGWTIKDVDDICFRVRFYARKKAIVPEIKQ